MTATASMPASKPKYVPVPPPSPKTRPKKAAALAQLLAIQKSLFDATQDEEIPPSALAQVARAWSDLEERKRVLKKIPAVKPIDATKLPSKSKKPAATLATPSESE